MKHQVSFQFLKNNFLLYFLLIVLFLICTAAIMQDLIISVLMRPGNQWSSHLLLKYCILHWLLRKSALIFHRNNDSFLSGLPDGWETQSVFHLHYNGNSLRCTFTIHDGDTVHISLEVNIIQYFIAIWCISWTQFSFLLCAFSMNTRLRSQQFGLLVTNCLIS